MSRPIASILLCALAASGCGSGTPPGETSALLVTLDTTRRDALSTYGAPEGRTPNLAILAEGGLVFDNAYTVAPLTLPSHASMLTGLYPPRHTLRDNGLAALPASARTLAERARDEGISTAAFIGAVVLDQGFGLDQGFELYDVPPRPFQQQSNHYPSRTAKGTVQRALQWLEERKPDERFFLWVHLWDPHSPYEPTPDFLARGKGDPYAGEVAATDDALGWLFGSMEQQGLWDDTVVVVVADHGEAFGEHGEVSHASLCYDPTMRVPLILRDPTGRMEDGRSDAVVSVADVHPTLADALGLAPVSHELDGRSLFDPAPADRGVYFESYYGYLNYRWSPLVGWADARGKLIHGSEAELFLPDDGDEARNVHGEQADLVRAHEERIRALTQLPRLERSPEAELAPELREAIQALGYATFGDAHEELPEPLTPLDLPSPKSRMAEQVRLQDAMGHLDRGDLTAAEVGLRGVLADNPNNAYALERLALCLIRQDRHAEAVIPLERALALGATRADVYAYLGLCHLVAERTSEAEQAFLRALEADATHTQALGALVQLLEDAERYEEAAPFREHFEALQAR